MALAVTTATVGIVSLAAAVQGYLFGNARWIERGVLFVGAMMLIVSGWQTDLIGVALIGVAIAIRFLFPGGGRVPQATAVTPPSE